MTTLSHHGIKGMKWGVRRDEAVLARIAGGRIAGETREDRAKYKAYKKATPRAERKADREKVLNQRINGLVKDALKNPNDMYIVGTPGHNTMMVGREFTKYLARGGVFDPLSTGTTGLRLDN